MLEHIRSHLAERDSNDKYDKNLTSTLFVTFTPVRQYQLFKLFFGDDNNKFISHRDPTDLSSLTPYIKTQQKHTKHSMN